MPLSVCDVGRIYIDARVALSAEKRRELSGPTADIHDTRIWREIHVTHGSPPFLCGNSNSTILRKTIATLVCSPSLAKSVRVMPLLQHYFEPKSGEASERGDHALKIKEL